jgi:hypothetical protein
MIFPIIFDSNHWLLIPGPAMLANQRHKLTRPMLFNSVTSLGLNHADELLGLARFSDWNNQASAGL